MDSQPDRLVAGRYRLRAPLGAGGMGTVWRAQDELLGREVAIKEVTFPPGLSDDERTVLRERTRREARAAAQLSHPSAVTVYDVVEHDDAPYLVMELVEARTLADIVRTDGALSPQRTAQVGLELLGALETAHRQGIVHRDVKPSNVMVRDDGRVVLTDFGIATTTGDASITHTGLLLGSPAYIAPERARGEVPGPPSDLWSLGATLFTAVEGRPPYDGGEPLITVTAVVTGEHAPFAAAGPLVPVLEGLLEKDPARRLDATRAKRLLQEVAASDDSGAARTVAAPVADAAPGTARTAALHVDELREEIAAAEPATAQDPRRTAPAAPTQREPPPAPPLARPQRPAAFAPNPRKDGDRPRWLVPAVVAGILLATTAAGVAMTMDDDPSARTAAPTQSPTPEPGPTSESPPARTSAPAPPPPTSAAPSADPSPDPTSAAPPTRGGPAAVPASWTTDTGGAGWTVALPPGYQPTRQGEYRQASTGRTLRIETGPGQPDAVEDRRRQARSFEQRHPSYKEIRIEPVDYRGYEAADWEFTYEGLHVINRVFVVDGTGHSLFFQTKKSDFADARADFDGIAAAFRPVGG
jgi:hypothetical protein